MELLIKNSPNHYDTGDVIDIRPDGFEWSTGALQSGIFTIIYGVTLTPEEELLLQQSDEALGHISPLPAFRSKSFSRDNLSELHRRKYQYINGKVQYKPNAQERI